MTNFPPELLDTLRKARRVAVLTGAGISAESGVPTFRDAQTGLWSRFRAEDLATAEAFLRDPKLVWDWYAMRREMVADVSPNPGHYALAAMAQHVADLTLVTQNIDSLHQRAGSVDTIELHGNISRVKCFDCGTLVPEDRWVAHADGVPRCPDCGGYLRPDVVWFGELLPAVAFARAQAAFRNADVVLSIGTSGMVPPAATLPLIGIENGAYGIEVNIDETYLTDMFDALLRGPSGVVLPALVQAVWEQKDKG